MLEGLRSISVLKKVQNKKQQQQQTQTKYDCYF